MRFLTVFLAVAAGIIASRGMAAERPNVIVIVADDLGFADVGFHRLRDFETPHLDALADSGVRFTNGYVTHPYCSPSRAAIMTGRYQQRFGHECNPPFSPEDETIGTPPDEVLMSQVMKQAGYRTCAIGKWHLGDADRFLPTSRGFDRFFGFSGGGFNYYGKGRREAGRTILRNKTPVPAKSIGYLTDDFSEEAVEFIDDAGETPFFLYLAYNAVHAPNQAPQRYLERTVHIADPFRTVYAAMTIAMDAGIGRVIDALQEKGLRENTLVIFVNDNGGRIGSDNRPLRGHKGMLFEGGVRVPFVMSWPGRLPAGFTYEKPVSALDILPTVSAAAVADTSGCRPLDGVDLLPYMTGKKPSAPHEYLYWRVSGGLGHAIRDGRYKLVQPAPTEKTLLFDLQEDRRETTDLSQEHPEVVARLAKKYRAWEAAMNPPRWSDPHPENVEKEHAAYANARRMALPADRRDGRP